MRSKTKKLLSILFILCIGLMLFNPVQTKATSNTFLSPFKVTKKVIYKGNGVSISVNDAKIDRNELKIEFYIKNNSKKDYSISAHEFAINNLMAGGNVYGSDVDVPARKKAKLTVSVKREWFQETGIKTFKKFDVMFWGYGDSMKEWESEKVSFSTNMDNEKGYYTPSKKKIYSDKNIKVSYLKNKGDTYIFCLKNNTDLERRWSIENCSINNWSYDLGSSKLDLHSNPILSGCYAIFELTVDKNFKKENSIKNVKKIEFNIKFEGTFDDDNNHIEEIKSGKIFIKK